MRILDEIIRDKDVESLVNFYLDGKKDFTAINLITISDAFYSALKNKKEDIDLQQVREDLLSKGAILDFNQFSGSINSYLQALDHNPHSQNEHILYLKRLYRGLSDVVQNWQNNTLTDQNAVTQLNQTAIDNLIDSWKKFTLHNSISDIVENKKDAYFESLKAKWFMSDPSITDLKKELDETIIAQIWKNWRLNGDSSFSDKVGKQIENNVTDLIIAKIHGQATGIQLPDEFINTNIQQLSTIITEQFENSSMTPALAMYVDNKIRGKKPMPPKGYEYELWVDTVLKNLVAGWINNKLPQNLIPLIDSIARESLQHVTLPGENKIRQNIEKEAIANLLTQFENGLIGEEILEVLPEMIGRYIMSYLRTFCDDNADFTQKVGKVIFQEILTEWKSENLSEEVGANIWKIAVQDIDDKLNALRTFVAPIAVLMEQLSTLQQENIDLKTYIQESSKEEEQSEQLPEVSKAKGDEKSEEKEAASETKSKGNSEITSYLPSMTFGGNASKKNEENNNDNEVQSKKTNGPTKSM